MANKKIITGFSKLNKRGKIKWIAENFFRDPETTMREMMSYWLANHDQQKVLDGISENTISNYPLPYSVAPNFIVDGHTYCVPMVIEESSVVAAAASAAKFWMYRGGFQTHIIATEKIGQIHFKSTAPEERLHELFELHHSAILEACSSVTKNMESRGGGVLAAEWVSFDEEKDYYQIKMHFETCDSMGANFINTVLETYSTTFKTVVNSYLEEAQELSIIMCILSNYTPKCLVRAEVSCPVQDLGEFPGDMTPLDFAQKFVQAMRIARIDTYRAVTHNKGIFNGIDSVIIATGNDFRAIEACGHAYAARDGMYRSLSSASIENGVFRCWLEIPLAVGTVGGLTKLHPMAKQSLEMLGNPNARQLMSITAAVGLAQNFAAVRSLITTGIQKGHMKMHLSNVLYQLKATEKEFVMAVDHFKDEVISHIAVREFLEKLRITPPPMSAKSDN